MRTNCLYTNVCGHMSYNSYGSGQEDMTDTMLCSLVALEDGNVHNVMATTINRKLFFHTCW